MTSAIFYSKRKLRSAVLANNGYFSYTYDGEGGYCDSWSQSSLIMDTSPTCLRILEILDVRVAVLANNGYFSYEAVQNGATNFYKSQSSLIMDTSPTYKKELEKAPESVAVLANNGYFSYPFVDLQLLLL